MNPLLKVAELLYRGINRLRRSLYRHGVLRPRRLPRPVISIGNIAAGGAGKTPAVIALCNDLSRRGLKVAVLTRGYGRAGEASGLAESPDAARYGDEPALIKLRTDNVDVIVGSNRFENATKYLETHECDVFVLDDAFQHLQLARDIDIVIDLPSPQFSREGHSALEDADFVIPRRLRLTIPEQLRGRRLFAFAGLASNDQFFDSLREAGLLLAGTRSFRDHHRYSDADLESIRDAARSARAEAIVTTEKDAVKLQRSDITAIAADFLFDQAVLDEIAARVRR